MPCYDPRDHEEKELQNSPLAEMLCDVLKRLSEKQITDLPEATQNWWQEHKVRDSKKS